MQIVHGFVRQFVRRIRQVKTAPKTRIMHDISSGNNKAILRQSFNGAVYFRQLQ
jgi:hypothetical protein